jgi:hypothetical protein
MIHRTRCSTLPLCINDDDKLILAKLLKFIGSEAMCADLGHFSQSSIKVCHVSYNRITSIILQEYLCTFELASFNFYAVLHF